jgi:hypothetical protein
MMWKAVSRSYVLCEKTRVPVYIKPSVKCKEAGVNGGEGSVISKGSSDFDGPHAISASWKYDDRETRMNL